MVTLIWSTDWHVSHTGPENRIDDYEETVFDKIDQIKRLCEENSASACLIGGDVFHIKRSSKVPHGLVSRLIKVFDEFPCPVYSIVGNHDISHNNLMTLEDKPLGVLFNSGSLKMLDREVFSDGRITVKCVGYHFDGDPQPHKFKDLSRDDEDYLIVLYHGYACETGSSYPGEQTYKYADLSYLPVDDWFFGHWHIDQGITQIGTKRFVNIGSLTRGSLTLENIDRSPKAVICQYSEEGSMLTPVNLKVKPASEIFNLEKKERADRHQELIHNFIEKLRNGTEVQGSSDDQIFAALSNYSISKEVYTCIENLLHESETELREKRG